MKKLLALTVIGAVLLASCQQKPAEQPAQEQPQQQQPAQQPQQEQQPAGEQKQEQKQPSAQPQSSAPAKDMKALAQQKGCFACHDINNKKVGPAFKDVANKEAGKVEEVARRIKNGGVGEWGNVPMPPQNVSEEEARQLAEWILSLK